MKLAVVILAAGSASRFGGIKQLARLAGQPMLVHCLRAYARLGQMQSLVVLGANADKIEPVLPDWTDMVVNPSWRQGMGSSLSSAMGWLHSEVTHLLVGLGDQPAIQAEQLNALIVQACLHPNKRIAAAYGAGPGVPAIFPRQDFGLLAKLDGDRGAKSLLLAEPHRLVTLALQEASYDIDTQDELKQWQQARGTRP